MIDIKLTPQQASLLLDTIDSMMCYTRQEKEGIKDKDVLEHIDNDLKGLDELFYAVEHCYFSETIDGWE